MCVTGGDRRGGGRLEEVDAQSASICANLRLEFRLHANLDLPFRRPAQRAGGVRQHLRDRGVAKLPLRLRELRVIEQVERLDAELGFDLPESRELDDREVDVELPGPRTVLRPVLPKVAVVPGTRAKAAVLNHMSIVGLSRVGSPIVSGRLFVMPVDSIVPDAVSGSPDRR